MNKFFFVFGLTTLLGATGCEHQPVPEPLIVEETPKPPLYFLALGDSYTIGQGVAATARFPVQLRTKLTEAGIPVDTLQIIAKTGWTTGDLKAAINNATLVADTFGLVTLLIGVNNQFRGFARSDYEVEFAALLETAIRFAGNRPERVFVLSIPDYAVTPFGQNRPNPDQISQEIDAFNASNRTITENRGVHYFDITPISREALNDATLLASDQLHPSGKMYGRWVDLMLPILVERLKP
ncbi:MAG: SGNH/GDSL hydrolase family protein [Saprospiraceae bacterium]|nr:SGNH/GDSL hydrolase family protein [Saprospiraceae bacterium]